MIPHEITLYNFLSYGQNPQTISFEGYGLICLSGRNGHGKSALLDAMTWSLWGHARKTTGTSRADEGLLRLGAKSMMVLFEFDVGSRRYRVRREFSFRQGNKPHLTLDFGVYDQAIEGYHSLTDKSIRQTQEVINRTVGLDYDTYVNSAYLRQGNSNEFSQKPPKERKKILSAILGIDKYDALQERVLGLSRRYSAEIELLKELITRDEQALEALPLVLEREAVAVTGLAVSVQKAEATQQEFVLIRQKEADYQAKKRELEAALLQLAREESEATLARTVWGKRCAAYRSDMALLRQLKNKNTIQEELTTLRQSEQKERTKQKEHLALQRRSIDVEKELFACEQRLKAELAIGSQELTQKQQAVALAHEQALALDRQLRAQKEQILAECATGMQQKAECGVEIEKISQEIAAYAPVKARFERRKTFYHTYLPRLRLLEGLQHETEQKRALAGGDGSSCPLCEQLLSSKRKQFLQEKLAQDEVLYKHQVERLKKVLERLKPVLLEDHAVIKVVENLQNALQAASTRQEMLGARQGHLEVRLVAIEDALTKAGAELQALKKAVDEVAARRIAYDRDAALIFEQNEQRVALRALLKEVAENLTSQTYNDKDHARLEQDIAALERELALIDQSQQRLDGLGRERALLGAQRLQLKEKAFQQRVALGRLAALKNEVEQAHAIVEVVTHYEARLQAHSRERESFMRELGEIAAQKNLFAQQQQLLKEREVSVVRLECLLDDCFLLSQAWGKNGIQAFLIEQAIPEIEMEANELLGRLTNNQAHVFIESLRDLKRGGARETLDIKIADAMGVRPYEMFSGGEAFRIDFALRIAISKLLAKRAGATLQVLIIDEGFGSQDEEGLTRLMDALYAVQDDFARIIVVTHLPAFKENFPVHFIVEKGASGSQVSVELRG